MKPLKGALRRMVLPGLLWAGAFLSLAALGVFRLTDYAWHDFLMRFSREVADPRVAVVAIDERSLDAYGRWPWPRQKMAALIERVNESNPAVIALDIILSEALPGEDPVLAEAMRKAGNVVLPVAPGVKWIDQGTSIFQAEKLENPLECFRDPAAGVGHVLVVPDSDGRIRRVPAIISGDGSYIPGLAVQAVQKGAAFDGRVRSRATGDHPYETASGFLPGKRLYLRGTQIALDHSSSYRIAYPASWGGRLFSAADVMADRLPPGLLDGKIVLIGVTAAGVGDRYSTPLSLLGDPVAGVLIQAASIHTLLTGGGLRDMPLGGNMALYVLLGLGLVFGSSYPGGIHPRKRPVYFVSLAIAVFAVSAAVRTCLNLWVPISAPFLMIVTGAAVVLRKQALATTRLEAALTRYTGIDAIDGINPEDKARRMGIIFADLRGWSRVAATLEPEEAVRVVKPYLAAMAGTVRQHGGRIDKFAGDAVMAVFEAGNPRQMRQVIGAARNILKAVKTAGRKGSRTGQGLKAGIGIAFGRAVMAEVGDSHRSEYTVIGSTVNLARALEDLAGPGEILLGWDEEDADTFNGMFSAEGFHRETHPDVKGCPGKNKTVYRWCDADH